jgi:hypothetical protein
MVLEVSDCDQFIPLLLGLWWHILAGSVWKSKVTYLKRSQTAKKGRGWVWGPTLLFKGTPQMMSLPPIRCYLLKVLPSPNSTRLETIPSACELVGAFQVQTAGHECNPRRVIAMVQVFSFQRNGFPNSFLHSHQQTKFSGYFPTNELNVMCHWSWILAT